MHPKGTIHRVASNRDEGQVIHDQRRPSISSSSAKSMIERAVLNATFDRKNRNK